PAARRGSEVILVVEDEAPVRALVQTLLGDRGYRVVVAADGPAAIELFARHAHEVALLLTDIVMPHMSGRVLGEQLRMQAPGLKILYMSGYTSDVIGSYVSLDSKMAFLQKPFTPEALARKVREVLDGPAPRLRA
ncbi:MAG: response regulator, partial [Candidatus Rokuibacteriota bacterium]